MNILSRADAVAEDKIYSVSYFIIIKINIYEKLKLITFSNLIKIRLQIVQLEQLVWLMLIEI